MAPISHIPKRVLCFNSMKKLIGVFQSVNAAAKAFGINVQPIHYACTGQCISTQGYYFRHLSDDVEVSLDDLGTLRVDEYDELCGIKRKIYKNKSMSRAGMKYRRHYVTSNKQNNNEDNS